MLKLQELPHGKYRNYIAVRVTLVIVLLFIQTLSSYFKSWNETQASFVAAIRSIYYIIG